jgi:DNA ligase-associated metallophosphoesterase
MNKSIPISWNKYNFTLLADRAIYWPKGRVLYIADPHFGKAATFRYSGIPVPEECTQEDCNRIELLVKKTGAESIVFLGDFFHALSGKTSEVRKILYNWRKKNNHIDLYLIRGNHDLNAGDPWKELDIQSHPDPSNIFGIECRHLPVETSEHPYLAGHIHPGYTLKGKGKRSIRAACFHLSTQHIILPAFGSFTGLKNIKPNLGDQVFITNGEDIFKIPLK